MQIGTSTPDNLIAGDFPRITATLSIPTGNLKRGTVVTRAGAAMKSNADGAAAAGLKIPFAVLAADTDASSAAAAAPVFLSGEFSRTHLVLADNAAINDADWDALRALNIFVKDTVQAV